MWVVGSCGKPRVKRKALLASSSDPRVERQRDGAKRKGHSTGRRPLDSPLSLPLPLPMVHGDVD